MALPLKISELPAVTTPVGADEFAVNQSGTTKKMTLSQINAGDGIYGGSGTVPSSTVATLTGDFSFNGGNVGIGLTSPEGPLHIGTGTPSTVNPTNQADDLIVQNSDDAGMTLFAPDDKVTSFVFGSPSGTGNEGARLRWNPAIGLYSIVTTETGADIIIAPGFLQESIRFKADGRISIGSTTPDVSAKLQIFSTTQGFIPPKMTTVQRDAIALPASGLIIYNTTTLRVNIFDGIKWLTTDPIAASDISSRTLKSTLAGTEGVLINDAGTLKKTTAQDIADLGSAGGVVFGSEFEIFQSLAQSNTGASSTDKVDATSASKPAGTYRIGFYCDITNSDGTDIWEVQFLVNGTAIHQHSNGGNLYQNKPDGNNDWSSESSVHYITLGTPATIDMNIKFGTNDNTARAANATIEIWRVS